MECDPASPLKGLLSLKVYMQRMDGRPPMQAVERGELYIFSDCLCLICPAVRNNLLLPADPTPAVSELARPGIPQEPTPRVNVSAVSRVDFAAREPPGRHIFTYI